MVVGRRTALRVEREAWPARAAGTVSREEMAAQCDAAVLEPARRILAEDGDAVELVEVVSAMVVEGHTAARRCAMEGRRGSGLTRVAEWACSTRRGCALASSHAQVRFGAAGGGPGQWHLRDAAVIFTIGGPGCCGWRARRFLVARVRWLELCCGDAGWSCSIGSGYEIARGITRPSWYWHVCRRRAACWMGHRPLLCAGLSARVLDVGNTRMR